VREVDERSNRLARALRELEVGPDDTVATSCGTAARQFETLFAGQKLGITIAPLNTWGREQELAALLERLRPRVLIADPRHAAPIASSIPRTTALVTTGPGYEDLIAPQRRFRCSRWRYRGATGGSSSTPRAPPERPRRQPGARGRAGRWRSPGCSPRSRSGGATW
jgi:acyl-CoA synthetase (AMP-forming)/AMP-acid ligase II